VKRAIEVGGKILVPVFAVGRTQLLLYLFAGAFQRGTLSPFPIYIDSPMAIEATKIYGKHTQLFDAEALAMHESGELQENLETVKFCPTAADSRALNHLTGTCLILAGAGMCTGGRILHHFRHNLARPGTTVLIVGYQGHGSLGRMLVDGKKSGDDLRREDSRSCFGAYFWRSERARRAKRLVALARVLGRVAPAGLSNARRGQGPEAAREDYRRAVSTSGRISRIPRDNRLVT
jgi:hypothetical protein